VHKRHARRRGLAPPRASRPHPAPRPANRHVRASSKLDVPNPCMRFQGVVAAPTRPLSDHSHASVAEAGACRTQASSHPFTHPPSRPHPHNMYAMLPSRCPRSTVQPHHCLAAITASGKLAGVEGLEYNCNTNIHLPCLCWKKKRSKAPPRVRVSLHLPSARHGNPTHRRRSLAARSDALS